MTDKQKIFEGLSYDWKWASWCNGGLAYVHKEEPCYSKGDVYYPSTAVVCRREEFDEAITIEGISPKIIKRADLDLANRPYIPPTDGRGSKLVPPVPPAPVYPSNTQMFTQDVFLEDLSNGKLCKYAALNANGVVWLFEHMPTLFGTEFMAPGYMQRIDGKFKDVRAGSKQCVVIEKGLTGAINSNCADALKPPFLEPQPDCSQVKPPVGKPCTFAEQGCIRLDCDGDHGFETEAARDEFYGNLQHPADAHLHAEIELIDNVACKLDDKLYAVQSRVKAMFDNEELTVTQVCAILGEFPW